MRTLSTIKRDLQPLTYKDFVKAAQTAILSRDQGDCPVVHSFGPGLYIRELTLKKGGFVVGHYHRFEQQNIMLHGHIRLLNEDGTTTDLKGPNMFVGKPGRKMCYVIEETVWLNVFNTEERDIGILEDTLLDKDDEWIDYCEKRLKTLSLAFDDVREDYLAAIKEFGLTHQQVRQMVEVTADLVPFPMGSYQVRVDDSPIDGKGLFATSFIKAGSFICPARVYDKRTPAGRYTNHSNKPNGKFIKLDNGDIYLVAIADIEGCKGGTVGDEITIDYRGAMLLNNRKQLCLVQ